MTTIPFTSEQAEAIAARSGSRLLFANAGSGKTAVLVERIVETVHSDGVTIAEILALTFTEKAAAELKTRVKKRFVELGDELSAAGVDKAWIGTIHGFCLRLLRSEALAAGLSPRFTVLDEGAAQRLIRDAFDQAFSEWLNGNGEHAIDIAAAYSRVTLRQMIVGAHSVMRSRGETTPVVRLPKTPDRPDLQRAQLLDAAETVATELADAKAGKRVGEAQAALLSCRELASWSPEDVPHPAQLNSMKLTSGAKALTTEACEQYREMWVRYRQACSDFHAYPALEKICQLFSSFTSAYAEEKRHRGVVDFDDLQLFVRDLLVGNHGVRTRWSQRFRALLIDEFQDTNPVQLELLDALANDNLFAVGDEFQSIYGFRHADVNLFRTRRVELGSDRIHRLRTNFRSDDRLIDTFNAVFESLWAEREFEALVAGLKTEESPQANGDDAPLQLFDAPSATTALTPLVDLLLTSKTGWEDSEAALGLPGSASLARRAEARLLASEIKRQVANGRAPAEIVVLVRATDSIALIERALIEQGLPTYVVGGRGFWETEELRDMVGYISVLANPLDEFAFYGVLASPFCGVGSDALMLLADAVRESCQATSPTPGTAAGEATAFTTLRSALQLREQWVEQLPVAEQGRLERFVQFFARERATAENVSVAELIDRATRITGYDLAILRRSDGARKLANLRKLMRIAREFEANGGVGLPEFLAHLRDISNYQESSAEATLEVEGLDAIRLMTIHRSKGLEFPVVCVAGLGRKTSGRKRSLLVGRDGSVGLNFATLRGGGTESAFAYDRLAAELEREEAEEEERLFYVALTRARERLILSASTDLSRWEASSGAPADWLIPALVEDPIGLFGGEAEGEDDPVNEGIYTRSHADRKIACRWIFSDPNDLTAIVPAAQTQESEDNGDQLEIQPLDEVVISARKMVTGAPPTLSYTALTEFNRCAYRFYLSRIVGLPPDHGDSCDHTNEARTDGYTVYDTRLTDGDPDVFTPDRRRTPGSPSQLVTQPGRAQGILVHEMLERLDFEHPEITSAHVDASELHAEDAITLVHAFTASAAYQRISAATEHRCESPFAFVLDLENKTSIRITGAIDRWAREHDGTTLVVDYKTDGIYDGLNLADYVEKNYAVQRSIYALAALRNGADVVDVLYLFLRRVDEPVSRRFTQADLPQLEAELRALTHKINNGNYPVTDMPHRSLCHDCPGRAALCSHEEYETLAPLISGASVDERVAAS